MPRRKSTHVDDPVAVGQRLREAREGAGLTQKELSFQGCSPAYISRIESGDRIPSLQLLREMANRLGVSEDYLATGGDRPLGEEERLLEAEAAFRLDDVELAEELFRAALERSLSLVQRVRALAGLGQLAFRRGDPQGAIEHLERAQSMREACLLEQPALADTLGRAYFLVGKHGAAIALFRQCLAVAREQEDQIEQVRFGVLLANALIDTGEFAEAGGLLQETVRLSPSARDPLLRARLYWSQSRLNGMQNRMNAAARYARKALEIVELTEHELYTARAHELLAHIELDRDRPEEALALLRTAWPTVSSSGNPIEKASFRLEEARALAKLGRSGEAASMAMEISGLLADVHPQEAGRSYGLLGEIYEEIGETERAQELYELAAELLEKNPNRFLLEVYSRLSRLLEQKGKKDEALGILHRAVELQALGIQPKPGSTRLTAD